MFDLIKELKREIKILKQSNEKFQKAIEILRESNEFYANKDNWGKDSSGDYDIVIHPFDHEIDVALIGGKKARQAKDKIKKLLKEKK